MNKDIETLKDLSLYLYFQGMLIGWKESRLSKLEIPYDDGPSPWYEASLRLGIPLNDVKDEYLKHKETEVWAIPNEWLDKQPNTKEIIDNE